MGEQQAAGRAADVEDKRAAGREGGRSSGLARGAAARRRRGQDDAGARSLGMVGKYAPTAADPGGVWRPLLANANVGGENVHRGAVLGAALGAAAGYTNLDRYLIDGLAARVQLASEIDAFVRTVME